TVLYRFGPFRVDPAKRRLWRDDRLVPLTPKAFDTLLVLVQQAGQVVEKDEILKAVWPDTFVEEATVAQNVSTLRKAGGDTSETPIYIATAPRRGYRFLETVTQVVDGGRESSTDSPLPRPARSESSGTDTSESSVSRVPQPSTVAAARRTGHRRFWLAVALALAVTVGVIGIRTMRTAPPAVMPIAPFALSPTDGSRFSTSNSFMAVSPDGRYVAFVVSGQDGTDRLWLRALDSATQRALPDTDGASQPFWSPDSRFVAFFTQGKLKTVSIASGSVQMICNAPTGAQPRAGTWSRQGDILF